MTQTRHFDDVKRIVVKIGTSSLLHPNGKLNLAAIDQLSYTLSSLNNTDKEVILVSSGAIGVGMGQFGLTHRPTAIPEQQALASVGQSQLMTVYQQRFATYGTKISQVLLTYDVFEYTGSLKNTLNTFQTLLNWKVIPIVNENDTVAIDELGHTTKFGDNDQLSALVAAIVDADLLIILSDIDGFFDKNPQKYPDASLIQTVNHIDDAVYQIAGGSGSDFGTGGMYTKLKAAQRMMKHGKKVVLANGSDPKIILDILAGKQVGTLFDPN